MSEVNKTFAKVIANFCNFLEFSDAKVVDQDAAVQMMEQLAFELQELPDIERVLLCSDLVSESLNYEGEVADFVKNLPSSLGLNE
ncbi:hypothetical protein ABFO19_10135 [Xanthomonas citri pv. glycines]|uniref:MafI family immunity protein n=1 Tax=Xanthomonas euvesicatoria TaxID=456327 RepID=A0AAW3U2Y0_XANEU|nr:MULTISPECIES: hypothetical protein [Xanthomonas]AEO42118.1 hypothetical protein XACM_1844 [Xanthomonas euvesicatoria pv. citrumelo F1]AZB52543.1 hypothetical protein BHE84_23760 [Xanthomonas citri pv. glycines str. 8ra]MBB4723191.1 hypothetical protein [Xanthomonas euvesicatoria]MBB4870297.1 hypothetical protein [Xanthomonas euvesicatoria]PPU89813.1 hypothetical protein XaclCFBP3371_06620 [Xanthomonas euvesicatoria pv. citrumelonis]